MTKQSYQDRCEEVVSSVAGGSTSSADISSDDDCPQPSSFRQKKIVQHNDGKALVGGITNQSTSNTGTKIYVKYPGIVNIGDTINGDVTINTTDTNLLGNKNGVAQRGERVTVIHTGDSTGTTTEGFKKCKAWRPQTTFILVVLCVLIFLVLICQLFKKTTDSFTEAPYNDSTIQEIFIPRAMWGGRDPLNITLCNPALLIIIKHTGGQICSNFISCSERVRQIQKDDINVKNMVDIRYNFLIGGDGRAYIGRDWLVQNEGWPDTIDIAFIGNFTEHVPTDKMFAVTHHLITHGASMGAVDFGNYHIVCHNQTRKADSLEKTDSPGKNLCIEVQRWMYYMPGLVIVENNDT